MHDAYTADGPRYASRVQLREDPVEPKNTTTEEDDSEKITPLPDCLADGSNGVKGVDCKKPKAKKMCKNNLAPTLSAGEEQTCVILPACVAGDTTLVAPQCF